MKSRSIRIHNPRKNQKVGELFKITGTVPNEFLTSFSGRFADTRVFIDILDINGKQWRSGQIVETKLTWLSGLTNTRTFSSIFQLYSNDITHIEKSEGCMNIQISSPDKHDVYVPIRVAEFEPVGGINQDISQRHLKLGEMIRQYKEDLNNYRIELDKIKSESPLKVNITDDFEWKTTVDIDNEEILQGIFRIISSSETEYNVFCRNAKQAQEERLVAEKYKDALEWRGPLARGVIQRWKGFAITVYSHDHDTHFHVIHGEKGIDARFSFPDLELIDYKMNRKTITSKEERGIQNLLREKDIFERLKNEIEKRSK